MKNTLRKVAVFASVFALTLSLATSPVNTSAADVSVFVTISNGELELANARVNVKDIDADNNLTINDALYCAHEQYYVNRAEGYGSAASAWGLSLTKLWGIENGGSYGYYLNDGQAFGLTDPVKSGDHIYAYIYTDTAGFSDKYTFFDKYEAYGTSITLKLMGAGYDENWNIVTAPVAGAVITVNGKETAYRTDSDGFVTIKLTDSVKSVISADISDSVIVPPVCIANDKTRDNVSKTSDVIVKPITLAIALFVILFGTGSVAFALKNGKVNI